MGTELGLTLDAGPRVYKGAEKAFMDVVSGDIIMVI